MAQKKSRKRSWLSKLLLFILTPILIWIFAFAIWFFWRDITRLLGGTDQSKAPARDSRKGEKITAPRGNKSQEKIPDEDRRKLDEILKNR